jgi:hypothetical protein
MKGSVPTPLGAVARGAIAGAVGTLAMDVVWYARYQRDDGKDAFVEWEFSAPADWNEISAPGQVEKSSSRDSCSGSSTRSGRRS